MKSALNNPFVSSWLSRRGDSASLLQVQNQQQSRPAACRSLPPLNDRQRSCQIDSLGRVELISHFRWGKYLHRSAAYSAVLILHNFVLLPPVTLGSFTEFALFLQGFPDMGPYLFTSYIRSDRARELHSFPARLDFSRSAFFLTPFDIIFRLSRTVMCEITRWPVVGRKRSILARSSHKARLISGRKWGIRLSCCLSHPRLMGRLSHKAARFGLPFFSSAIQLWMWKTE